MNKKFRLLLGLAICVIGLVGEPVFNSIRNVKPTPTPVEVKVDEPPIEMKTLVDPVVKLDISSEDADMLSCFYTEMADVISKDTEFLQTTEQFRKFNITAGKLYFDTKLKNKYETLGESIDQIIMQSIGKESVSLDSTKRAKLVNVLKALAWSVKQ
jgi:hypothetical protein